MPRCRYRPDRILGGRSWIRVYFGVQKRCTRGQVARDLSPSPSLTLPLTHSHLLDAMADLQEKGTARASDKDFNTIYTSKATPVDTDSSNGLYDPSKEHWTTRAGLSWESYKRAPGATG